ncbi:MAG: hypothetical protein H0X31_03555 [Nostocaceae cyanobacterium]|nr:hypothetical protein [Nostocaceae cyanobacterium]
MDQNQHESRQVAAQDFMKSLQQLEGILQEERAKPELVIESPQPLDASTSELSAFEQAAADIEKFMQESQE